MLCNEIKTQGIWLVITKSKSTEICIISVFHDFETDQIYINLAKAYNINQTHIRKKLHHRYLIGYYTFLSNNHVVCLVIARYLAKTRTCQKFPKKL